ncbi:hypothetical protein M422DRAFT_782646 [Sphaerobolus stellatus SS14]|uniref:O-methyltransferase domain-containing protein n=1 Tax=Sphaerobolus stellatus (strain SS14) TaxID=990650 RepID=A0A0C9VBQ3_SPHS4|nr:hypothetical protein M422DRAFT_782646 [Sphaerobolus stellatus SS14]
MPVASRNGNTEVIALANLISNTAQEILSEYSKAGQDIPSLDSTDSGPFDAPEKISVGLAKAIRTIEAACAQLAFTVASPGHVMANKVLEHEEPACMLVAVNAKVADHLLDKPEGLHVAELAEKANLDADKLGRILRLLATKHCFREVKPNVFANNRLSMQMVSTNTVSSYIGHIADESVKGGSYLNETLTDPKTAFSTSAEDSAFRRAHGASLFEFYNSPANSEINDRFAQALVGWGNVTGRAMLPRIYAWENVSENATLCDVGGNKGHMILDLMKKYPKLKAVIQDLPTVLKQAKEYWAKENPQAVEKQRVEFVPIDFLKEPPVPNCDFYYLRHILHDWPTSDCQKILTNVRKAMGPNSRLLIHEFVLQHIVRNTSEGAETVNQAPEPLLPNYGMGRVRLYKQDINMMLLCNGKERTLQEFIEIAEQTGFKFEKLWDSGEAGLIEFTIA